MERRVWAVNNLKRMTWHVVSALVVSALLPVVLLPMTNEELRRYGFGTKMTDAVNDMRETQPPRDVFRESDIPTPQLPTMRESKIPETPLMQQRVFRQSGPLPTSRREGPTADHRHEKANDIENTFREVQNFFFRPKKEHKAILSMNGKGVTGLWTLSTATVQRKGSTWFSAGVGYSLYDRSFGRKLDATQRIEAISAPFTYMTVPIENLETSLQLRGVDESGKNFPIPTQSDWETSDLQDVQVMGKYRFMDNKKDQLSAAVGMGMRIGVEENVVTRRGSSGVDYETFLTVTKGIKNFSVSLEGGLIFPNGEDRTNSGVADIQYGNFGMEFRPNGKLNLGLEANYLNWDHGGHSSETTLGAKYRVSRDWVFDVATTFQNDDKLIAGRSYYTRAAIQVKL